ncbi:MAG: caspase family protein, partial [Myxococcota bacterium]
MIGSLVFATLLAGAPDARIVVAIGNDVGIGRDVPLDYAEADAKRFHQLMMEIGGVSEERSYLVVGGDARRVRSVLNEARGRIKELSAQSRTSLIVFVSSHADAEALHLGGTTLPLDELHGLVRGASADLKLTIVDACRTAATTYRGGQPVPEVDVAFGTPARVDGDVLITSASLGEPAQERAFLRGALFSHHLMTGLRGAADVDDDAVVSLTEAYTYAYRRTAADAPRGGATQRPSYAFDTRGFGSWVLTRPKTLDAGVRLSSELEGVFWVADNRRALVAEVVKARGEVVRLALAPGWYRVVRPDGRFAGVADVNLGWGGVRTLEADAFVRVPMSGSTLKGSAAIVARPLRLGLGYGAGLNPLPGDTFEHAPMLR